MTLKGSVVAIGIGGAIVLGLLAAADSTAQQYPIKAVRMIVPYSAGGSVDLLARIVAPKMSENMGQQVVVENRPGASGNIGTEAVVRAPPDGYMIVMVTIPIVLNPSLYSKLPFDVVRDLAPVSLVAATSYVLVAHPSLPVKSVKDLIALAKKHAGKLNYASGGNGTNSHIATELFKDLTGTNIVNVQYKGGGPQVIGILSGESDVAFLAIDLAVTHVNAGKLRPLGTTATQRSPLLPQVPTIAEAGVPRYEFTTWYGVLVPAGTPAATIKALNDQIVNAMRAPDVADRLARQNIDIIASTPAQLAAHIKTELVRWAKVVKDMGLRID
jgi:tripartite-type tricarboxylate transporter receptor subunit TctC